jgi:hypothetical protein
MINESTYFFRGEHMAVRNAEGGFYLCLAMQNVYKTGARNTLAKGNAQSKKITIQWLGLAPEDNQNKDIYVPEYYDKTGEGERCQISSPLLKRKNERDQWLFKYPALRIPIFCYQFRFLISEFETILTSVELDKASPAAVTKGKKSSPSKSKSSLSKRFHLPKSESDRITRLLKRSFDKESGKNCDLDVTEDNPDGRK